MILRAAFWIAVVAVLLPYEPNLGYGRPDGAAMGLREAIRSHLLAVKADLKAADTPGSDETVAAGMAGNHFPQSAAAFAAGLFAPSSPKAPEPAAGKRFTQKASGE